jgi:hypothetical protein
MVGCSCQKGLESEWYTLTQKTIKYFRTLLIGALLACTALSNAYAMQPSFDPSAPPNYQMVQVEKVPQYPSQLPKEFTWYGVKLYAHPNILPEVWKIFGGSFDYNFDWHTNPEIGTFMVDEMNEAARKLVEDPEVYTDIIKFGEDAATRLIVMNDVNQSVNRILKPIIQDHFMSPQELFVTRKADSKGYAVAKLALLRAFGFEDKDPSADDFCC